MGAFKIIADLGVNLSAFRKGLASGERRMTGFARRTMRDFRTATTAFFSVSMIKTALMGAADLAKNFEASRKEIKGLGVEFDEEVIKKAQVADVGWRAFVYRIKIGLMRLLPIIGVAFDWVVARAEDAGTVLGVLWGRMSDMWRSFGEMWSGDNFSWNPIKMAKNFGRAFNKTFNEGLQDMGQLLAENEQRRAAAKASREAFVIQEQEELKDKAQDERNKKNKENVMQLTRDSLAQIGGFTAHADVALKSIMQKQLRATERTADNTDALRRPIA